MNIEQEENLQAAMLAGMVKGKMREVDSLMTDRPDIPADRIKLESFINLKQPTQNVNNTHSPTNPIQNVTVAPTQEKTTVLDAKVLEDIESIKITIEKINNNLTKMCGMFGKVFQTLVKDNKK
jgi:hypothetical protein